VNLLKSHAGAGRRRRDGAAGMEEELPLSLVEEQAESAVSAEGSKDHGESESGEQPAWADGDRFGRGLWGARQLLSQRPARRAIRAEFRKRGR
jgi:hypothetical protein